MIEDLRFIERISYPILDNSKPKVLRILQAYDGHVWFDVPLYTLEDQE